MPASTPRWGRSNPPHGSADKRGRREKGERKRRKRGRPARLPAAVPQARLAGLARMPLRDSRQADRQGQSRPGRCVRRGPWWTIKASHPIGNGRIGPLPAQGLILPPSDTGREPSDQPTAAPPGPGDTHCRRGGLARPGLIAKSTPHDVPACSKLAGSAGGISGSRPTPGDAMPARPCPSFFVSAPTGRREFLRAGSASLFGLTLPRLLRPALRRLFSEGRTVFMGSPRQRDTNRGELSPKGHTPFPG